MKLHLLLAAAAIIAPRLAHADEAEDHVARGTRFYNVQDWANALKEYRQAYTLDPKPETLWAIAQTQRLSGDCRGAILSYKAFLRGASTAGANAAEEQIKQCQADVDAQRRAIEAGGATEPAKPVPVTPPPPTTAPPPVARVVAPEPRAWYRDGLGDTLSVVGVVGVLGGGAYLILGDHDMSATAAKKPYQAYDKAVDSARREQQIGVGSAIGGAVFLGLGAWRLYAVSGRTPDEHAQAFAPALVPGGALVTYGGGF